MKTMIARTLLKAVAAVALICGAGLQALAEGYKVEEMPNVQVENKDRYLTPRLRQESTTLWPKSARLHPPKLAW